MGEYKDLGIPVRMIGPGSQIEDEDGLVLDYMRMPNDMSIFNAPIIMDDRLDSYPQAKEMIQQVQSALEDYQAGKNTYISLESLSQADLDFVNKFFGEGEVSIIFNQAPAQVRIQETVLAGVWRIAGHDGENTFQAIEVGFCPEQILTKTFENANLTIQLPDVMPEGIINAPALLTELSDKSFAYRSGDESHIVNLTLLPQSSEDLNMLGDYLGEGPSSILSRGYGSCRVSATNLKNVWWVQYFNSDDKLILNTLEVVEVPVVTLASMEDLDDSRVRIDEMIQSVAQND